MSFNKESGGLYIELEKDTPTIIKVGDQEVRIYLHIAEKGHKRARFVASRDVVIFSPSRVRKGWDKGAKSEPAET